MPRLRPRRLRLRQHRHRLLRALRHRQNNLQPSRPRRHLQLRQHPNSRWFRLQRGVGFGRRPFLVVASGGFTSH
jgi:hypothetical protein